MKSSGQKLTYHKRIQKRRHSRQQTSQVYSEKRERRGHLAEALKDGEVHLYKNKDMTFSERMHRLFIENPKDFGFSLARGGNKKKLGDNPVPTEQKQKEILEQDTHQKQEAQKKSFTAKITTGFKNIFSRKVGQK